MVWCRELGDAEIKEELSRFKGVGPKTVACVLMFCLRRKEFPVDTHVCIPFPLVPSSPKPSTLNPSTSPLPLADAGPSFLVSGLSA